MNARVILVALASVALVGCADEATPSSEVTVDFGFAVNGAPFECGAEYDGVGEPAVPFKATDARFYLHDLQLLHASAGWQSLELDAGAFQGQGLALLDFENGCGPDGTAETHTTLTGRIAAPDQDFVAVRFTLGVPKAQNFLDLARSAAPLDVTGMYWTWQSGYKFLKVDGSSPASGGGLNPYLLHVGASGCPGENPQAPPVGDCVSANLARIELLDFSPGSKIVADLGTLLATVDLSFNTEGTAPGCMSEAGDPECLTLLPRLGIDDADAQQLFAIE